MSGYYGDPEAECQSFHICANDGNGGLLKYSFICPNGTVFNQQYFICDWWFNFDCSTVRMAVTMMMAVIMITMTVMMTMMMLEMMWVMMSEMMSEITPTYRPRTITV